MVYGQAQAAGSSGIPAVSIVMPFRNAEATLDDCLRSILAQTMPDFELIAINDHSDDGSAALINAYGDSRFHVVNNPGRGIVDALNHGLELSQAELVARMDADDIMHSTRLHRQWTFMQSTPMLSLCATQVQLFPEDIIQSGYQEYIRWQNRCLSTQDIARQIYIESPFAHPSVMFKKDDVITLGGFRDGEFAEDYDCWLRLFHAGKLMAKLDEVLLDWRESATRLSRNSPRYSRLSFDLLRAEYLASDRRLRGRAIIYWGAGRKTRQRASHLIERGFPPLAWIDIDPKKIGRLIRHAPVYAPAWLGSETALAEGSKPFVLVYVTNHGAREQCEAYLDSLGYQAGEDYLSVG